MEPRDRKTPPDARAHHRAYVLEHVVDGGLTIDQAAAILRRSPTATVAGRQPTGLTMPSGSAASNLPRPPVPGSTTPTWPSSSPNARGSTSPCGRSGGSWPRPRYVRPGPAARHGTGAAASGWPGRPAPPGRRQPPSLVRTRVPGCDARGHDRRRDRAGARRDVPRPGGCRRLFHHLRCRRPSTMACRAPCHGQLARRRPRPAAPERRSQLGRADGLRSWPTCW